MTELPLQTPKAAARRRSDARTQWISLGALGLMLAAWLFGYFTTGKSVEPFVSEVLPGVTNTSLQGSVYRGYDSQGNLIGYAGVGGATGYGGPINVLVGVDPAGNVIGVKIVEHRETPGFFRRLPESHFFEQFLGKGYTSSLRLDDDIDAVSGATVSSEAVARAVREQVRAIAKNQIGAVVSAQPEPIRIGPPEWVLIGLFATGYVGHKSRQKNLKKWLRRFSLLAGVILVGFVYNMPLSLSHFISLLSGYWPDWHTHLYWFILLGGMLFVTSAQGKNPYCTWFCPFGAVQEGMGRVANTKLFRPRSLHVILKWSQRGLAFTAILLGLAFRQPAAASFEPFGTLFDFTGNIAQWILLVLILLTSLVIYRPFCNYVCPMDPIVSYIGEGRRWVRDTWRGLRR
jgi:NosR/NirI family nitrous oxide reductase transcriptional regulator